MKALPLVLVVVLVASPALGAVGPEPFATPSADLGETQSLQVQASANETIHVLDIPESQVARSSINSQHVDLGPALGFSSIRANGRLQTLTSIERIESVADNNVRQQLILGEINRIEQRAIALQSQQQNALSAYNAGEMSARELVVELARIDAQARNLNDRRTELRQIAVDTPDFSLDSGRLAALERELDTFTGPVRAQAAAVLSGRADPARFFVRTSETGIVLSTIADDTYIREVYRSDLRDRESSGVTPAEALDVVAENYPTIWETRASQNGADVVGAGDSYLVRISHSRGQLFAYVDSGSGTVFKEAQIRPLDDGFVGDPATQVKDGLNLTVYRTYPGGPMRIALNESATDDPVSANVTLGLEVSQESTLIGQTDSDGNLWTLSPNSSFTVTVIRGNAAVVLTVSPTSVPELATNTSSPSSNVGDSGESGDSSGSMTETPASVAGALA
ncbi:hypothetical protein ACFQJC_14870 [Haloferax namakaokahaiae]|uniref:Uncharacterized protein n=1 Tax=Haloferax namakaokahaiae TaxID=1748331 RepID=A0ABD5ZHR5_9EURY